MLRPLPHYPKFKIYEYTFESRQMWVSSGDSSVDVTIPCCLRVGHYLMRNEQISLHVASTEDSAQLYLSCGQLEITSGRSKTPSKLGAFPGAYEATDPGILINIVYPTLTTYLNPRPTVFVC